MNFEVSIMVLCHVTDVLITLLAATSFSTSYARSTDSPGCAGLLSRVVSSELTFWTTLPLPTAKREEGVRDDDWLS